MIALNSREATEVLSLAGFFPPSHSPVPELAHLGSLPSDVGTREAPSEELLLCPPSYHGLLLQLRLARPSPATLCLLLWGTDTANNPRSTRAAAPSAPASSPSFP